MGASENRELKRVSEKLHRLYSLPYITRNEMEEGEMAGLVVRHEVRRINPNNALVFQVISLLQVYTPRTFTRLSSPPYRKRNMKQLKRIPVQA